jgi:peptide/nickel transport system ATP-binding protein
LVSSVKSESTKDGPLLDVRDLCVSFYDGETWRETLTDVSFAVEPGEVVGIVGESGCGKSLTALSILGLLPSHGARRTGAMHFEGRDLAQLSEREMRDVRGRRISMVFQEPMSALDPVFPVGEQIAETVRRHFRVSRREANERSIESLSAVGIPSPAQAMKMYPSSLSGGMRQRVLIAMALVCEPRLLIADEPTTALDVTIQAQIMDLLLELGQRTGTAILFITHNLGLVAESCRRMLTMYAGQVVEDGKVRDILGRPFHPYTAGLLGSIPRAELRKTRLTAIPGRVPSVAEMPGGCRFEPRCTYAEARCRTPQQLIERRDARHVRCCRADEFVLAGASA